MYYPSLYDHLYYPRLFLLCLLPLCSGAPQYYNYPVNSYPVYPLYQPASYPTQVLPGYPFAGSRVLITHSAFMSVAGTLEKNSAGTPVTTVEGTVEFHQNPATGSNSKYKIYLNGADMANKKYTLNIHSSCATGGTVSHLKHIFDSYLIFLFIFAETYRGYCSLLPHKRVLGDRNLRHNEYRWFRLQDISEGDVLDC